MTTIAEQFKTNPGQVLDRLVDGELAQPERRAMLALLDEEPSGWRACALAFVESQTWHSELGSFANEAVARTEASTTTTQSAARPAVGPCATVASALPAVQHSKHVPVVGPLGLAASVLLSLAVGWQLAVQLNVPRLASRNQAGDIARRDTSIAGADRVDPAADPPSQPDDEAVTLQTVQLSIDDPRHGVSEAVDLPVTEADELDAQWLTGQQSAMPAEMLAALEKAGHRVTQHSQVWPISLQDGRRLLVPVEQVEVQVAKSYQ